MFGMTQKLELPDTETEILAKFMKHEGGNSEEKRLIADIIVARKDSEEYPDTVKDIITQKRKFYLNTNFWNNLIKVSEEDIEIAKEVLESETHTSFRGYLYKNMPESKNFLLKLGNEIETYETENYIFFK